MNPAESSKISDGIKRRFTDGGDPYENTGFMRRNIVPSFWQIMGIYFAVMILFALIIKNVKLFGGDNNISIIISVVVFALGLFFFITIQKTYDIITANEFQNAIFAGSTSVGTEFTLITKGDGTVVYYNPGCYKYFPYSTKAGTSDIRALFKSRQSGPEVLERISEALSKVRDEKIPIEITDLEGNQKQLNLIIEPIKRPRGFLLVKAMNRSALEIELDQEKQSLEKIFANIAGAFPFGIYVADKNGTIGYVNDKFLSIFGYYKDDFNSKKLKLDDIVFNLDKTYCDLDKDWQGELTFFDSTNRLFKASISHHVITNRYGEITKKFGILRETEVKKQLSSSDFDYGNESFVNYAWDLWAEHSPIPQLFIDNTGKIIRNNTAFRNMARGVEMQRIGKNILEIINKDNREQVETLLKETVISGHTSHPVSVRMDSGSDITVSLYISPLSKVDGNIPGYICNLIDTTEQKNLEQRFVHSQKMQAVGQLAGGIAHDFNNLLTAMTGFCDLLLIRHPSGDPSFADIMQIKQNSNRAANLVRQLLAFSRKQTMHPETIQITDVLAELSNLIRRLIGENIELKIEHDRNLWTVRVDQGQLEQVIINLAVNARDAMAEGGALTIQTKNISIRNRSQLDPELIPPAEDEVITPGEYVEMSVIDTGHGIPADIIGKIFEPFFSTKEVGQGTGLGLSTVYGIIKQTGGYIYVASKVGKGTKFTIFLKRYIGTEEKRGETLKSSDESDRITNRDLTGAETILLVEDEDPVRIFSARALRNKGYSVLEADCGEAALEIVNKNGNNINLIVTDVVMPGITGPSMIEEVLRKYPKIKVIFISGYAEDTFVKTYGSERKFNFLPKPFTLKQLASKVKEVIDRG